MTTWKRWANLIVLLLALSLVIGVDQLAGFLAFFVLIIFYISLYALLGRGERPTRMPLAAVPISYFFMRITPAIDYLLLRMDLRRSQRIRAFLKLADDLRMRKQALNGFFLRGPRR